MSSTPKEKHTQRTIAICYGAGTLFSVLVTSLYYTFDHGLRDIHMTLLFLIPLIPGIVWLILSLVHYLPSAAARYAFNIASPLLWIYFLLMGIYTMAKTTSDWLILYLILAIIGYAVALIIEIIFHIKTRKTKK